MHEKEVNVWLETSHSMNTPRWKKIKAAVHAKIFKVKCPKCGLVAAVREGVTPCPRCGYLLKVELNIVDPDR